jgi:hypothetical protein
MKHVRRSPALPNRPEAFADHRAKGSHSCPMAGSPGRSRPAGVLLFPCGRVLAGCPGRESGAPPAGSALERGRAGWPRREGEAPRVRRGARVRGRAGGLRQPGERSPGEPVRVRTARAALRSRSPTPPRRCAARSRRREAFRGAPPAGVCGPRCPVPVGLAIRGCAAAGCQSGGAPRSHRRAVADAGHVRRLQRGLVLPGSASLCFLPSRSPAAGGSPGAAAAVMIRGIWRGFAVADRSCWARARCFAVQARSTGLHPRLAAQMPLLDRGTAVSRGPGEGPVWPLDGMSVSSVCACQAATGPRNRCSF